MEVNNFSFDIDFSFQNDTEWHKKYGKDHCANFVWKEDKNGIIVKVFVYPKGILRMHGKIGGSILRLITKIIEHEIVEAIVEHETRNLYSVHGISYFSIFAPYYEGEDETFPSEDRLWKLRNCRKRKRNK